MILESLQFNLAFSPVFFLLVFTRHLMGKFNYRGYLILVLSYSQNLWENVMHAKNVLYSSGLLVAYSYLNMQDCGETETS